MDTQCPSPLVCSAASSTCEATDIDAPSAIDARTLDASLDAYRIKTDAPTTITWKAITSATIPASSPATSVTIPAPSAAVNDIMLGVIAMGHSGETAQPAFTAPPGWTLVGQVFEGDDSALAVYWHVAAVADSLSYTFTFNEAIEGVAWISVYSGVSSVVPVDTEDAVLDDTATTIYAAPSVTTTSARDMLVVVFAAHDSSGTATTWTAPGSTNVRIDINNTTTRSALGFDQLRPMPGMTPTFSATASIAQDYALVQVTALQP